jgi:hypothetical protein
VVARYGEVARVEDEVTRGWAVKGGKWEEYLRVLGWFGEGMRWFGEGFCGSGRVEVVGGAWETWREQR